MNHPGLYPAFEPARPLSQPGMESRWRLLVGGRADHRGVVAKARKAHSQVGVFGHVVGVPRAYLTENYSAEVIRRTAERQRQPPSGKTGKKYVEQAGVLRREDPCKPGIRGIIDGEL